jgi:hypothetical protein
MAREQSRASARPNTRMPHLHARGAESGQAGIWNGSSEDQS